MSLGHTVAQLQQQYPDVSLSNLYKIINFFSGILWQMLIVYDNL